MNYDLTYSPGGAGIQLLTAIFNCVLCPSVCAPIRGERFFNPSRC